MTCRHHEQLLKLQHDTYEHQIYGTCEACEYNLPVKCSECEYNACCGIDLDEHELAMMHV